MFGQPYNSGPQSYQKYAAVKGYPTSQVPVVSAINGNLKTILLLSAAAAAAFTQQFPTNGRADNPALIFDGKEYAFTHRDPTTGNIIFEESAPVVLPDVNEGDEHIHSFENEGEYTEDGVLVFIRDNIAVAVAVIGDRVGVPKELAAKVRSILFRGLADDVNNLIRFIPDSAEVFHVGKNANDGANWPIGGDGEERVEVGEFPLCG